MSTAGTRSHGVIGGWIPDELQTQILSRLRNPASIARFRCVSKSWRRLFSDDPEFVAKILFSSTSSDPEAHVMTVSPFSSPTTAYSVHSQSTRRPVSSGTLPGWGSLYIAGCAEGILCLTSIVIFSTRTIILWNPTTSEAKLLPPIHGSDHNGSDLGFGFDPVTEDYKVIVWIWDRKSHEIFVYSLRKNSWRRLRCCSGADRLDHGCQCRVGIVSAARSSRSCHWISAGGGRRGYRRLTSFDVSTEAFAELEMPEPPREKQRNRDRTSSGLYISTEDSFHMAKDGSCLVAVYSGIRHKKLSPAGVSLQVWVALDVEALGRQECCWMKLYDVYADGVIPAPATPPETGVWEHGEFFFVRWILMEGVYKPIENGMVDQISGGKNFSGRVTYRPSTISLSGYGEAKKSIIKRAKDTCRSICRKVFVV
ncbi:unnamed protein product [Linum trigynum]|uniref:F-box domain-containing protein n=1 Tax=Linum trigynum TaxID=586398 RepID=A0AAV2D2H2_9ROSI